MPSLSAQIRNDHWYFDGWVATRDQLEVAGIPAPQIFIAELCTASHPDALCSYRRDGAAAGRMAGAITGATPRP
jgi:copper oxidase (laccase) domain-containing protein